ncbi:MAG: hypothetical protein WC675_02830 [Patescibacteria group bacterium]|jgi:hypothetical protein
MSIWSVQVRFNQLSSAALQAEAGSCGLDFGSRDDLIAQLSRYYQCHSCDGNDAANGLICLGDLSKPTILVLAEERGLVPADAKWKDVYGDIYERLAADMKSRPQATNVSLSQTSSAATFPDGRPDRQIESQPSRWRGLLELVLGRVAGLGN